MHIYAYILKICACIIYLTLLQPVKLLTCAFPCHTFSVECDEKVCGAFAGARVRHLMRDSARSIARVLINGHMRPSGWQGQSAL